jgi:hypothetical protein
MTASLTLDHDLSPETVELLRRGVTEGHGLVCRPGEVRKLFPLLREAERLDYLRFLDVERPWITPAGRAAIGAPTEAEADHAKLVLLCGGARKPLVPAKRDDPRTDFDYRSYRSIGYVCVLVVKQADHRENPTTLRVGRTLSSEPQFLGPKNSILLPESEGRFSLALMPAWLVKRAGLSTYPLHLDEDDPAWTEQERETWSRLRQVCYSVNSRIRNSNRRPKQNLRFGETA